MVRFDEIEIAKNKELNKPKKGKTKKDAALKALATGETSTVAGSKELSTAGSKDQSTAVSQISSKA